MRSIIIFAVAAITSLTACHKSPTSPSPATGLPGTWRATRAEYVSLANSNLRLEVISLGATLVLTLNADGTYVLRATSPGSPDEVINGTWSASADVLTIRRPDRSGDTQFDMSLATNTLTLEGGHVLFDVNGDDVDEECLLNMTLQRQ